MAVLRDGCLSFVSKKKAGGENRNSCQREGVYVVVNGRIRGLRCGFKYTPAFTVYHLIEYECKRASKSMRENPPL